MTLHRSSAEGRAGVLHLTVVCGRVVVRIGGGQCGYQRFHVHDEVLMAQRVKTLTLTKLGSEKHNRALCVTFR